MKINEIFYSMQGEGKWTGLPNIFIRLTGCNLRCKFCDTKYAYENGKEMDIREILNQINKYDCKYICITGGEPLLQDEVFSLIRLLLDKNYKILIETNGSLNIEKLTKKKNVIISLDIKCPSSNMEDKNYFDNISLLGKKDQLKFVINDKNDYNYAKKIIEKYLPKCDVIFQPVWGSNTVNLFNWIKNDNLKVRIGLQLHKILWGEKKGV